ncbi:MAG: elongation factor Ts [Alteromonas naphthalenivorans]|jgi:elongation factor Ts
MAKISLDDIQKLRTRTSMGMMDCKKALQESEGDMDKAVEALRKKGAKVAAKRGDNLTDQGLVHAYIHPGSTVGVLIELNCETDFVARNEALSNLAQDLGMHIAAMKPLYLNEKSVDQEWLAKEKNLIKEQLIEEGKKPEFVDKIVEGKVNKIYSDVCLLKQKFVKDDKFTVEQILQDVIGKMGENVKIRRFVRYEIGV